MYSEPAYKVEPRQLVCWLTLYIDTDDRILFVSPAGQLVVFSYQ
jgi:hypothetical protein